MGTEKKECYGLVCNEIERLYGILNDLDPGDEKYQKVADNLSTLCKIKNEQNKTRDDYFDKLNRCKLDKLKIGTDVMISVASYALFNMWMRKGLKFEETGTFTSTTFRSFTGLLKPKK